MNAEELQAYKDWAIGKCKKASLTETQTEDVVAFSLDPWHSNERDVEAVVTFFKWQNDQEWEREAHVCEETPCPYHTAPSGLLEEVVR